jgi:hypothetical protein
MQSVCKTNLLSIYCGGYIIFLRIKKPGINLIPGFSILSDLPTYADFRTTPVFVNGSV